MPMLAVLLVLGLEVGLMSQTDGFFKYSNEYKYVNNDKYELLLLPKQHGLDYDYYADNVPLESGCLLLLGMGLFYAKFRKRN